MHVANDRSFAGLLQDIVGSVREILRLEIRLARAELSESFSAIRRAAIATAIAALAFVVAFQLLVLSIVFALALVMPLWAAALVVAGALAIVGGACVFAAYKRFGHVRAPSRTIHSVQENMSWPTT